MKKTYLIALSLLFFSTCKLQAQVVNNEEGDNDETEITVTNAQGKRTDYSNVGSTLNPLLRLKEYTLTRPLSKRR